MSGWRMIEQNCEACGRVVENLVRVTCLDIADPCPCGAGELVRCMSAPKVKTVWAWVTPQSGPREEPPPGAYDTEHLAHDGMSWD